MIIKFDPLSDMTPYGEEQSVFSMRIGGRTLAEHVINSMAQLSPTSNFNIQINDTHLFKDKELSSFFRSLPNFDEQKAVMEPQLDGNRYFLSKDNALEFRFPWHLLHLLDLILSKQEAFHSPGSVIEDSADIQGNVHIGSGTRICRGAILRGNIYIGADCLVGFHSVLRGPCSIEDGCKIGHGVEIKNTIIQNNTFVGPLCYVGDSIIGASSSLGALTRTSNFRLDRKGIPVFTKQGWVDTGRNKLGCFIGNDVQIGASVITFPGVIIGNHIYIGPQVLVNRNLESNTRYYVKQQLLTISNSFFPE